MINQPDRLWKLWHWNHSSVLSGTCKEISVIVFVVFIKYPFKFVYFDLNGSFSVAK